MIQHLSDFADMEVTYRDDAYFIAMIPQARDELLANGLKLNSANGVIYESGAWIERPSDTWTDDDKAYYATRDGAWWQFNRHIKSRAARLHNRAHA